MKIYTPEEWQIQQKIRKANIKPIDTTAFNDACTQFKQICNQIKELLGVEQFKGGFDQMAVFQASQKSKTTEGLSLAMQWSAFNQLCKYEGNKLGLGQPDWWYKCWEND